MDKLNKTVSKHFEWVLASFILIGLIKKALVLFNLTIPIDLTIVVGLAVLMYALLLGQFRIGSRQVWLWAIPFVALFAYSGITLSWTIAPEIGWNRWMGIGTAVIMLVVSIGCVSYSLDRLFQLILLLSVIGSLLYLFSTMFYDLLPNYFAIKDAYLYLGKFVGASVLAIYVRAQSHWDWSSNKVHFTIGLLIMLMLFLGSRGALFFSIGLIAISALYSDRSRIVYRIMSFGKQFLVVSIAPIVLFAISLLPWFERLATLFVRGSDRFLLLYNYVIESGMQTPGKSIGSRLDYWIFAVEHQLQSGLANLFGNGLGSFGTLFSPEHSDLYPHNILIELWFELGFIGLILFVAFLYFSIRQIRVNQGAGFVLLLMVYELLHLMKSHSLADLRYLVLLAGAGVVLHFVDPPKILRVKHQNNDT